MVHVVKDMLELTLHYCQKDVQYVQLNIKSFNLSFLDFMGGNASSCPD